MVTAPPTNTDQLAKEYYVNVGPGGTFTPSGNPDFDSTPSDVDNLFARLEQQQPPKLVLYFHGGLVSLRSGMETAQAITDVIRQKTPAHPIAFVWETGLLETVGTNLRQVSSLSLFDRLKRILLKVVAGQLGFQGARGGGGTNLTDEDIDAELTRPEPFESFSAETNSRSTTALPRQNDPLLQAAFDAQLETAVVNELNTDELLNGPLLRVESTGQRGIFSALALVPKIIAITKRVIDRFADQRDHGFFPTVVEELARELFLAEAGAWVWGKMKEKAELMWQPQGNRQGLNQLAGRYFLDKLAAYQQQHPTVSIDLVGHSAGSIAICHLLKTVRRDYPALHFRNVVFLAPACRCDLFDETFVQPQQDPRFATFRMLTMKDENECKDQLVPLLYTRSLLYLISGVLEDEGTESDQFILGMQRYLLGTSPYDQDALLKRIRTFLSASDQNRQVFSVTDDGVAEGLRCNALSHGSFDENLLTKESMTFLING